MCLARSTCDHPELGGDHAELLADIRHKHVAGNRMCRWSCPARLSLQGLANVQVELRDVCN